MRLNLSTEGLAGASARRPWLVIGAWAVVLVVAIGLIATLLSSGLTTEIRLTNNPESQRADTLLKNWQGERHDNEVIIVQSQDLTVSDAAFQAKVQDIYQRINALGSASVFGGTDYYQSNDPSLVSADRHVTIMPFQMSGSELDAADTIDGVLAITGDASKDGSFKVLAAGTASINHDFQSVAKRDLETGESIGIPIALIVLVLVFGALTAAIVPIILGIFSIIVAIGITAGFGQAFQFSFFVTNVITMMGLAVGIDYSLFIVSRHREERSKGLEKHEAITAAGATASRAVFFSGTTVVFALLGMLLIPSTIFRSLGAGAIIVVVVSVLVTLTLLPAILGLLGDRVNSLRVPFIGRSLDRADNEHVGGVWDRVTRTVMRFPVISLVAAIAVLVALAVPYLDIKTGSEGVSTLPRDTQAYTAFKLLEDDFNFGRVTPTRIVVHDGDVTGPEVQGALDRLKATLAADPLFGPPAFDSMPHAAKSAMTVAFPMVERLERELEADLVSVTGYLGHQPK